MNIVSTPNAPQAIGPYSQAIEINGVIYSSGQIALRPDGSFVDGDVEEQTTLVMQNLSAVLEAAGSSLQKVVKTTIFLANMDDFTKVNAIYGEFFGEHKPARSTVCVKSLPKGAQVEIEVISLK